MNKRIFEIPIVGPFLIGVSILLCSALVVWGVKKFISGTNKTHRELIYDLENKSFGNKWVSALELTKVLSQNKTELDTVEIDWILEHLTKLYQQSGGVSGDDRLRHFIISATTLLHSPLSSARINNLLVLALFDQSSQVQLSAVNGLSLSKAPISVLMWEKVEELFLKLAENQQKDDLLQQSLMLLYAQQEVLPSPQVLDLVFAKNSHKDRVSSNVLCAAALTLVPKQSSLIVDIITNTFEGRSQGQFCGRDPKDREKWIMNFLNVFYKYPWQKFQGIIKVLSSPQERGTRSLEVMNLARVVLKKWGAT